MSEMTAKELVAEARASVAEIDPADAAHHAQSAVTVIDVREPAEFAEGHLPGAVNIPRGVLEFKVNDHPALTDRDRDLVIYCKTGGRGALAAQTLSRMGFSGIFNLTGGFDAWCGTGMPTEKDPAVC